MRGHDYGSGSQLRVSGVGTAMTTASQVAMLVILTHQHIDHLGLVAIVAARSGAEVAAIDAAVPFVENYSSEADADDEFARDLMVRHGIPPDVVAALQAVSRAFRGWGARVNVTRPLRDGDTLVLRDRTLHVLHRPGHSRATVFHDRDRSILIAGDHALPGHGEPITGHRELIDERMAAGEEDPSAHSGAAALRVRARARDVGQRRGDAAYLAVSEVLGHLDLLVRDGCVREVDRDGVSVFVGSQGDPARAERRSPRRPVG
jgi:hypothetical protein